MAITKIIPVVILITLCNFVSPQNKVWYPYQTENGSREEMFITKVDAVDEFKTNENITKWTSLSLKDRSYALGLTRTEIVVLQAVVDDGKDNGFVVNSTTTSINSTISNAIFFEYWDYSTYTSDIIVVVVIQTDISSNKSEELRWYRIDSTNKLVYIWTWNLMKNVTCLNVFEHDRKYNLVVCSDHHTVDVYEFHLGSKRDFWMKQTIPLDMKINSIAINYQGPRTFLAVPQHNRLHIFMYKSDHFIPFKNVTAAGVNFVTGFKIGFQSFLAIDGYNAGLYKYTQNSLIKQNIPGANLNGTDFWLSIPIKTHTHEEVIIAQRSLDHGSHRSYILEILMYNGDTFKVHEEMTCDYYGDISNGMNCLLEEDKIRGIQDAAFLSIGNVIGILIPKHHGSSGLFMIHTETRDVPNPIHEEIKALNNLQERLQGRIDKHLLQVKELRKVLEVAVEKVEDIVGSSKKSSPLSVTETRQADQNSAVNSNFNSIKNLAEAMAQSEQDLLNLNEVIDRNLIPIDERGNTFKTLIAKGTVEVQGISKIKSVSTNKIEGSPSEAVLSDIVRLSDVHPIPSLKTFFGLATHSLGADAINGVPTTKFVRKKNGSVEIEGVITFKEPVTIERTVDAELVNKMNITEEIVQADKFYRGKLRFEELNVKDSLNLKTANKFPLYEHSLNDNITDNSERGAGPNVYSTLYIPGNITVEYINGENLNALISSLCITNVPTYIPNNTVIDGDIVIKRNASIEKLNNISFPSGYVFANSDEEFIHIKGHKIFSSKVIVNELSILGNINGIEPKTVVTLSGDQILEGNFTFNNLTVTDHFDIDGDISEEDMEEVLPNPTLLESQRIHSNVNFKELEVEGNIFVDIFNGSDLRNILEDIVYKGVDSVKIDSVKEFKEGLTVRANLDIESKTVNNIPLDGLINKDLPQVMKFDSLNGSVTFDNLIVTGSFGGVNITQLEQETVKLSGEQFIYTELIFEEEVIIEDLEVLQDLNAILVDDLMSTKGDRVLGDVTFGSISATNLRIESNLTTEKDNFNLEHLENTRLSFTKDQLIPHDFILNRTRIQYLNPEFINEHKFADLFDPNRFSDKIVDLLLQGKLRVIDLNVEDSVTISSINNVSVNELMKNVMWSTSSKRKEDMIFKGTVEFNELDIEFLNNVNFTEIKKNVIYKNESENLKIHGTKIYQNGIEVDNYISSPVLNDIKIENILRKTGNQLVKSPLVILGNVTLTGKTTVDGTINGIPITNVTKAFNVFDENTYVINGDVMFNKVAYIDDLKLEGLVNNKNLSNIMNNIIDINRNNITGVIIFKNTVTIDKNLAVDGKINGIDLSSFAEEIMLISQDSSAEGTVQFLDDVVVHELISVNGNLMAPTVSNVDFEIWKNNSVFINKGKIQANITFEKVIINKDVKTDYVNGIDMKSVIPLRSDQIIEADLLFEELSSFNNVGVGDTVNGLKLEEEYENTVLANRIQQLASKLVFEGNVLVRRKLDVLGPVNGHDMFKLVSLKGQQNLTAKYEFMERVILQKDLVVDGLVNGVNITDWYSDGVKKFRTSPQNVTNPWIINKNLTFGNKVIGNVPVGGMNVRAMADLVEQRRIFKYSTEDKLITQYRNICEDINKLIEGSKKQIYQFKHLEHHQLLHFTENVVNLHSFEFDGNIYLIASGDESCISTLFSWSQNMFLPIQKIETGTLFQIITVRTNDSVLLVGRGDNKNSSCPIAGTHVWQFENEELILLYKMEDMIVLHESLVPATFYGMDVRSVTEFAVVKIGGEVNIRKVQKWNLDTGNAMFIPHGLGIGLSLRNGKKIVKLNRDTVSRDNVLNDDNTMDTVIYGNVSEIENRFFPGVNNGDMLIMKVAYRQNKVLIAVALHEETRVEGNFDTIKIYEDATSGYLFQKLAAYKPTSLLALDFDSGETLLMFLEDNSSIQIFTYKGLEGFKHSTTVNIPGIKLFALNLRMPNYSSKRKFVAVVNGKQVNVLEAVMDGDYPDVDLANCEL